VHNGELAKEVPSFTFNTKRMSNKIRCDISVKQIFRRIASQELPFALNLAGTIFALWLRTRNNEWEVLMRVRPLLRNSRHRAKITPVRIALEWELSIDWEFNSMLYGSGSQTGGKLPPRGNMRFFGG